MIGIKAITKKVIHALGNKINLRYNKDCNRVYNKPYES